MPHGTWVSKADRWCDVDARLESALQRCSPGELLDVQALVLRMRADRSAADDVAAGLPDVTRWLQERGDRDSDAKTFMLLGAVALALAWLTHRARPAPTDRLRQALTTIGDGHAYMLAIPRSGPCFCGSDSQFRYCHGQPPVAA
jgi:hypothetical protein